MAEAVGLALGAAGLFGLFSTCLQYFELVEAGRSFARDHTLLSIRYEVEKTRLLVWGDAAGLFRTEGPYGNSLDKEWISSVVEKILFQIKLLFDDTTDLRSRYGLERIEDDAMDGDGDRMTVTTNRFKSFGQHLAVFQEKMSKQQKQANIVQKTRWAIRDRKKFTEFVETIRELIDGLREVTPDLQRKESRMVKEDVSVINDPEDLRLLQDACIDTNPEWSDAANMCIEVSSMPADMQDRVVNWMDNWSTDGGLASANEDSQTVESSYHLVNENNMLSRKRVEPKFLEPTEVDRLEVGLNTGNSRAVYMVPVGDGVVDGSDVLNRVINGVLINKNDCGEDVKSDPHFQRMCAKEANGAKSDIDIVIYCAPDIPALFAVVFALRLRRRDQMPVTRLPHVRIDDRLSSMPPSEVFSTMKSVHSTIRSLLLEDCYMWLDEEWLQNRTRLFETGEAHGKLPAKLSAYDGSDEGSESTRPVAASVFVASLQKTVSLLYSIDKTSLLGDREGTVQLMNDMSTAKRPFFLSIRDPHFH